jgi:hypothetical protein
MRSPPGCSCTWPSNVAIARSGGGGGARGRGRARRGQRGRPGERRGRRQAASPAAAATLSGRPPARPGRAAQRIAAQARTGLRLGGVRNVGVARRLAAVPIVHDARLDDLRAGRRRGRAAGPGAGGRGRRARVRARRSPGAWAACARPRALPPCLHARRPKPSAARPQRRPPPIAPRALPQSSNSCLSRASVKSPVGTPHTLRRCRSPVPGGPPASGVALCSACPAAACAPGAAAAPAGWACIWACVAYMVGPAEPRNCEEIGPPERWFPPPSS